MNEIRDDAAQDPGSFPMLPSGRGDGLATRADGLVESAGLVLVTGNAAAGTTAGSATGLGLSACFASVVCGVVVGVVVVAGVTLVAVLVQDDADRAYAAEQLGPILLEGGSTLEASWNYQSAFDARRNDILDGVSPARSLTGFEEFVAVTYSWQCQNHEGGEACVGRARDWAECVAGEGGVACHRIVGGLAQYELAQASLESERGSTTRQRAMARRDRVQDDGGAETRDAEEGDCFGVVQGWNADVDPDINISEVARAAEDLTRSRLELGGTFERLALICPEHLITAWFEELARAMNRHFILHPNRWRFGRDSDIFADYVRRIEDADRLAADCDESDFPVNSIEIEDPESVVRVSNQRDATDALDGYTFHVVDDAGYAAMVRHGNLASTLTDTYRCQ